MGSVPFLVVVGLATSSLLLASCIGVFKQWGDETSLAWKAQTFEFQSLEGKRVAVLNAFVGMTLEGYRHQVSQSLFLALSKENHPFKLISPQATKYQLNREGLAREVSAMAFDYSQSGILNLDTLHNMARTLEWGLCAATQHGGISTGPRHTIAVLRPTSLSNAYYQLTSLTSTLGYPFGRNCLGKFWRGDNGG